MTMGLRYTRGGTGYLKEAAEILPDILHEGGKMIQVILGSTFEVDLPFLCPEEACPWMSDK